MLESEFFIETNIYENGVNLETIPFTYLYDQKTDVTSVYRIVGNKTIVFIVNKDASSVAKIDGPTCITKNNLGTNQFDILSVNYTDFGWSKPILRLNELFQILNKYNFTELKNKTSVDGYDSQLIHYASCNRTIGKDVIVDLAVYKNDAKKIESLEFSIIADNNTNVNRSVNFKFINATSGYGWKIAEHFLPPVGYDCGQFNPESSAKKLSIKFPDSFSIRVEYTNVSTTSKTDNHIFIDAKNHIVSFDHSSVLIDQVINSKKPLNDYIIDGDFRIFRDFSTGLQYAIHWNNMTCKSVIPLPANSTDSYEQDNKTFMKDTFDVLLSSKLNYSYVGLRNFKGVECEVFIASSDLMGQKLSYEIYISKNSGNLPTALLVYREIGARMTLSSEQYFYAFKEDASVTKFNHIAPCLKLVQNYSYLLLELFSENPITNIDFQGLKIKLIKEVAERANVSVLRIDNLYFQPVNQSILYTFFTLSDQMNVNGSDTAYFTPEIDVVKANENLNKSIIAKEMMIDINGIKLKTTKNGLNFVPPFFTSGNGTVVVEVVRSSRGAMAALAIFMLIIGMAGGFGLAFFLYKRNRGIPYQIYE
uniref:Uncharacterized protein n=1 Tax=Romanomermis culicivorax TaxID=13658 RepID=A0A915INN2_ROMCU